MCKELLDRNPEYIIMFNDAERGLNNQMLNNTGIMKYVDEGRFQIKQECDIDATLTLIDTFRDYIDLFVIDSLAALDSGMYLGKDRNNADNPRVGGDTRSLKVLLKQMLKVSQISNVTFMFTNHLRPDIGAYVESTSMGGGVTPEYLSSLIVELRRIGGVNATIKDNQGNPVLVPVKAIMRKSRYGPSKAFLPFYVRLGYGAQTLLSLKTLLPNIQTQYNGQPHPMIEITAGSALNHLYLNGKDISFRGADNSLQVIKDNYQEIMETIKWQDLCPQVNTDVVADYLDPSNLDVDSIPDDFPPLPKDLQDYISHNNLAPDTTQEQINITPLNIDTYKLFYNQTMQEYTCIIDEEAYMDKTLSGILKKINTIA